MERIATIERKTAETEISLTINLDGTGKCDMENPIGFFNHMLNSFCKHGLFDISGSLKGDLDVDQHHLIEDTGIALGMAFAKALGNCAGIFRSGSCLYPMDECLCQAAVDFGGRPYLVCNAELSGIPHKELSLPPDLSIRKVQTLMEVTLHQRPLQNLFQESNHP